MSSAVEMPQLSFAQVRSRYREKGSFFTIGSHRQEAHESAVGMPQQAAASSGFADVQIPRTSSTPILQDPEEVRREILVSRRWAS